MLPSWPAEEINPVDNLMLDFQPLELRDSTFLFKPSSCSTLLRKPYHNDTTCLQLLMLFFFHLVLLKLKMVFMTYVGSLKISDLTI